MRRAEQEGEGRSNGGHERVEGGAGPKRIFKLPLIKENYVF